MADGSRLTMSLVRPAALQPREQSTCKKFLFATRWAGGPAAFSSFDPNPCLDPQYDYVSQTQANHIF
jgi:hypothetical protein